MCDMWTILYSLERFPTQWFFYSGGGSSAGATSGKNLDPDSVPMQGAAVENTPICGC